MDYKLYKKIGELYERHKGTEWNPEEEGNREKCIYANFPLAIKSAMKWKGMGLSEDELVSAAMYGLCQAYDKYKPENGVRKKLREAVENGCTAEEFALIAGIKCTVDSKEAMLVWIEENTKPAKFSSIIPFWVKAVVMKDLKAAGAMLPTEFEENDAEDTIDDAEDTFAMLVDGIPTSWVEVLEMRYGLGCDKMTLRAIADKLGTTIAEVKGMLRGCISMMRKKKEMLECSNCI